MSTDPIQRYELADGAIITTKSDGTVEISENANTRVGRIRLTRNELEDLADLAPALALEAKR